MTNKREKRNTERYQARDEGEVTGHLPSRISLCKDLSDITNTSLSSQCVTLHSGLLIIPLHVLSYC